MKKLILSKQTRISRRVKKKEGMMILIMRWVRMWRDGRVKKNKTIILNKMKNMDKKIRIRNKRMMIKTMEMRKIWKMIMEGKKEPKNKTKKRTMVMKKRVGMKKKAKVKEMMITEMNTEYSLNLITLMIK